jgi:ribosome-associated protein
MSEKSVLKKQALSPDLWKAEGEQPENTAAGEMDERLLVALRAAGEKKALRMVALDLRGIAGFTDYFVIVSGTNQRQVQAICDSVEEQLKKKLGVRPARIEGYNTAEWVLADYGDLIIHIFEEQARQFYDLERLWREGKRLPLPPDIEGEPVVITLRSDA